jgi:hypothetical protein
MLHIAQIIVDLISDLSYQHTCFTTLAPKEVSVNHEKLPYLPENVPG